MRPGAVRTELGISRDRVAGWAGVADHTAALYEAGPEARLTDSSRARLDAVYAVLSEMVVRLQRLARREV